MANVKSYQDLLVWQKAMDLVVECYRFSRAFPQSEQFGLTMQIRRAAVSIPANVAEGYGRATKGEYVNQLSVARGSVMELETHFIIAQRLQFMAVPDSASVLERISEVGRMLSGLLTSLRAGGLRGR